jgi:hypothetical protein
LLHDSAAQDSLISPMLRTMTENLVVLVYCRLDDDTHNVLREFFLAVMCIVPVSICGVALGLAWGTDDALHFYLIITLL